MILNKYRRRTTKNPDCGNAAILVCGVLGLAPCHDEEKPQAGTSIQRPGSISQNFIAVFVGCRTMTFPAAHCTEMYPGKLNSNGSFTSVQTFHTHTHGKSWATFTDPNHHNHTPKKLIKMADSQHRVWKIRQVSCITAYSGVFWNRAAARPRDALVRIHCMLASLRHRSPLEQPWPNLRPEGNPNLKASGRLKLERFPHIRGPCQPSAPRSCMLQPRWSDTSSDSIALEKALSKKPKGWVSHERLQENAFTMGTRLLLLFHPIFSFLL